MIEPIRCFEANERIFIFVLIIALGACCGGVGYITKSIRVLIEDIRLLKALKEMNK